MTASLALPYGLGGPMSASPRLNPWEVDAIRRKAYTKKYCLAPDAGDAACSGGIVNAHSVQGTLLRRIARDGHVYGDVSSIGTLQRNLGQFTYGLVGVNLASTFTGFCNLHDTKIFAPIEKGDFIAGPEQCFLLAYRAMCREVFVKRATLENADWIVQNVPPCTLALAKAHRNLTEVGLRDLQWHKDAYDRDLRSNNFSALEWVAIELSNTPDFVCSGLCFPDYDFAGKRLQDLSDVKARMQLVTFSVIPTQGGGIVVFAWHSTSGPVGWQLAGLPRCDW